MSLIDDPNLYEDQDGNSPSDKSGVENQVKVAIKKGPVRGIKIDPSLPIANNIHYRSEPLLNGSSPNMNVDGSGGDIVFTIAPAVGETWYAKSLSLQIEDGGQANIGKFGNINGGLVNGLLIQQRVNGLTTTLKNLQFNEQIVMHFTVGGVVTGNVGIISAMGFFQGHFSFDGENAPMTLRGDNGDKIDITVRDDISEVNLLRLALTWWRSL